MGDIVHTSRIKIVREKCPTRRATIEAFLYKKRIICRDQHLSCRVLSRLSFLQLAPTTHQVEHAKSTEDLRLK